MALTVIAIDLPQAHASGPSLGTAANFAVLGGSTVTNTGASVVTGDLGVSPGSAVTGFPPGVVVPPSTIYAGDAVAAQAHTDTITAYDTLLNTPFTDDLTGQNLGGLTLSPGVYHFDSSAQLTGPLILDGSGNYIFQIGSTFTTASDSAVTLTGGANADDVFWQVGSSATMGTDTTFVGNALALTSITLDTGTSILDGRALAINGAVTMDDNAVTIPSDVSLVPEPSPSAVGFTFLGALALLLLSARKKSPLTLRPKAIDIAGVSPLLFGCG